MNFKKLNKRRVNNKHFNCYYCNTLQSRMKRHLQTIHNKEERVKQNILKLQISMKLVTSANI